MAPSSIKLLPVALLASIAHAGTNHVVTVGKGSNLAFDPPTLNAAVGDTVTYQFFSKNHAVAQSSFADPCHPLDNGFFSGFVPTTSPDTPSSTTFTITVNDTAKAIWVYCPQTNGNHCQSGMVHSINAQTTGNATFDLYKKAASTATTSTIPPAGLPVGGERVAKVEVGVGTSLMFSPNNLTEPVGTIVQFSFNPKNHSVVQSNFTNPCLPMANGFSSGFVPSKANDSGALFEIAVVNTSPIWFYCAQTTGNHCQSGMVGSVNAAPTGDKTLSAFIALAAKAPPPSIIPPQAPIGGTFTANGTVISSFGGNAFNPSGSSASSPAASSLPSLGSSVPPPGQNASATWQQAGGSPPLSYNWGSQISDNATNSLFLTEFLDNVLLEILFDAYAKLNGGAWSGVYPKSIVETIGTMAAQALVHRSTATDTLQHFNKPLSGLCQYKLPNDNVDDFLDALLAVLLLDIGSILDVSANVAATEPWLVPALTSQVGSMSRMAAVVNMMQNHLAAAAVREAVIPGALAWSYAYSNYVSNCPSTIPGMPSAPYPPLKVSNQQQDSTGKRVAQFTVDTSGTSGGLFMAWIGPWGSLEFTSVAANGVVTVPADLYGHVWAVMVSKTALKLADIPGSTVAGPYMLWVSSP